MNFSVKGPAAIPVILLVLGFVGYRAFAAHDALEGAQADVIKTWLTADYSHGTISGVQTAMAAGNEAAIEGHVERMVRPGDIEFTDISIKGTGSTCIARLTIRVKGDVPPDGEEVRYFRMKYVLGEWRVDGEARAFSYYSKLF